MTGVAGPDPDEDGNPVGLVCIAVALKGQKPELVEKRYGTAPRERIQEWALAGALKVLLRAIESHSTAASQPGTQRFASG
jgi:nicotinamide-nucleotide amidase